ncbi:MAG: CoA transferase [Myxococcales bacterium]|nr:CoA transferase [Myxococcales bacterium]
MLDGVRILEVAMFAPDAVGMHLADLGAEVIKVEALGMGDPARLLGVPIGDESPASRRWNRGKHSVAIDLRTPEGAALFLDLVGQVDAVVEGMRPGSLERRGLSYERLVAANPKLVYLCLSGWGEEGPYRDLGSHGLAFDAYAGLAPARTLDGRPARPDGHVWQGIEAAPLYGALAVVSAVLRARASGQPSYLEVSQADAGAVWNGWRLAYEASTAEPDATDAGESAAQEEQRRALRAAAEGAGASGGDDLPGSDVRYQYYAASDGLVLLMATETRFWENFCRGTGRTDLFERWPGAPHADHDYGNDALRNELSRVFSERSRAEWVAFFIEHDVAGAPVYGPGETHVDPHFASRGLWLDPDVHGMRTLGSPVRVAGRMAVTERASPRVGADTESTLRRLLGCDDARLAQLRESGAIGGSNE